MAAVYLRNAVGALLVFGITNYQSLCDLRHWVSTIRLNADPVIAVFGNKTDVEGERAVTVEQAEAFCGENGFVYCQGSAQSGIGIKSGFETPTRLAVARRSQVTAVPSNQFELGAGVPAAHGCC
jgi:GTPase SAR1 family protein